MIERSELHGFGRIREEIHIIDLAAIETIIGQKDLFVIARARFESQIGTTGMTRAKRELLLQVFGDIGHVLANDLGCLARSDARIIAVRIVSQ